MNSPRLSSEKRQRWSFPLHMLTEYRTQLMGICAIGVILCHAAMPINGVVLPSLVKLLFSFGNQGVDVFFLLSGISMYYSLQKNPPLGQWYWKRFLAIGVSYLFLAIPFYIWYVADAGGTVLDFFCHLSTIGFWLVNFGAWYLAVLIPLYVVTPFVGRLTNRSKHPMAVSAAVVVSIFLVCLVGTFCTTGLVRNVFARFLRAPAFFVGYGIGKAVQEKKTVTWWLCPGFVVFFLFLICLPNNGGFAYNVLYIPIVMILCVGMQFISAHMRWLDKVFCWCGERSLELYLTNIFLPYMFRDIPIWDAPWNRGNYVFYLLVIGIGVLLSQVAFVIKKKVQAVCLYQGAK